MNTALVTAPHRWRSRTTFVLALSASSVSLGNLWRFSYLAGENGGAPFVLTYVVCLFLVAVPLLVAEVALGSHGRASPLAVIRNACDRSLLSRGWVLAGVFALLTGLAILTLYSMVAGWCLAYAHYMSDGVFAAASPTEVGSVFANFIAEPVQALGWISLFLLLVVTAVALGVRRGLGLVVWLAVPALVACLGFLVRFGLDVGDMAATREFLFSVQAMDFTAGSMLAALGHALFTLGVGVGTGIAYGAYAPERLPIGRSVMAVAVFDTMIALLAGLAVFPVVFANNLEPAAGPGLLFISVPYAFGNTLQGEWFGGLFFVCVVIAAYGSAVAIMEPVVASLMQWLRLRRFTAAVVVGAVVWSLACIVTVSLAGGGRFSWAGEQSLFQWLDGFTASVMLPLSALSIAVFMGWRMRPEIVRLELRRESAIFFSIWRFLLRYIAPLAILVLISAALIA